MKVPPLPAVILAAAFAATGCGGSEPPGSTAGIKSQAEARPSAPLRVGITQGRVGDATSATDAGPLRRVDRGRRIDLRRVRDEARRRAGVGAGDACADADIAPAADNLGVVAVATLCLLNGQRADHGLAPLADHPGLADAAAVHSRDMVTRGYFAHAAPEGSTVIDRVRAAGYLQNVGQWTVGENLAWGTGGVATPRSIVQAWMESPGHRDNILRAVFREIGIGVVFGTPQDSGDGATYTTAFGAVAGTDPTAATGHSSDAPTSTRRSGVAGSRLSRKARAACRRAARSARRTRSAKAARRVARRCRARAARRARARG